MGATTKVKFSHEYNEEYNLDKVLFLKVTLFMIVK